MGNVVLGVAGAVIGGYTGIDGAAAVGFMVGSALGTALFPEKGPDGPRLSDVRVQESAYGAMIPILFGAYRVAGNIIWATKLIEHEEEADSGSGGGGATNYTYTVSFAVALCEGPIIGISRIWADGKLIFNKRADRTLSGVGFNATGYNIHLGDEDQLPDPVIEMDKGVGNVPAHRGMAYMVFADLALGKFGNRIPNLTFEIMTHATNVNDGVLTATDVPLAEVMAGISRRCGMSTDQYDVLGVTNYIHGFGITNQMTGRSAMEPLMTVHFIDAVESDNHVKYVQRGVGSTVTIPVSQTLQGEL